MLRRDGARRRRRRRCAALRGRATPASAFRRATMRRGCSSRSRRPTRRPRAATAAPAWAWRSARRLVELMGGADRRRERARRGLDVLVRRCRCDAAGAAGAARPRRGAGRRRRAAPAAPHAGRRGQPGQPAGRVAHAAASVGYAADVVNGRQAVDAVDRSASTSSSWTCRCPSSTASRRRAGSGRVPAGAVDRRADRARARRGPRAVPGRRHERLPEQAGPAAGADRRARSRAQDECRRRLMLAALRIHQPWRSSPWRWPPACSG